MKRLIAVILAALLLFGLAACGAHSAEPDDTAPGPAPKEDIPEPDPKEDVPEPAPDEPAPAFAAFGGFKREGELRDILPVDSGKALIVYGTVKDSDNPLESLYVLEYAIFDTEKDEVLYETEAHAGFNEYLIGVRENGEVLIFNWFERQLGVYSADLSFDRAVQMPEGWFGTGIYYGRAKDCLYYSIRNELYEMPLDCSSETLLASFDEGSFVSAFDPDSGLAVCLRPYEEGKAYRELTLYDTTDGSIVLTAETGADEIFLRDGKMTMCTGRPLPDADGESISNHYVVALYDTDPVSAKAIDLGAGAVLSWDSDCIPYIVGTDYSSDGTATPTLIDFAAGKKAVLPIEDGEVSDLKHCYFPETGRCLIAATIYENGEAGPNGMGYVQLYDADPSGLEFTETLREEAPDSEEASVRQRDENRQILRRLADGIEEDFNVKILIGDECLDVAEFGTYEYTSTDAGDIDRSKTVYGMLKNLREHLSLYPDGFFDTFYDDEGEGGLQILVVDSPRDTFHSDFSLGGFSYQVYSTYYVVVDAMLNSTAEAIVPHEMWHSVEQRIWNDYPGSFDSYTWNEECNPPDFEEYVYDLSKYEAESDKWDRYILQIGGEDPYFHRSYSLVNDKEDRATLIELLFNQNLGDTPADSAEALRDYPHLRAKLDFMAERVREVFGTVYWEENG